MALLCARPDLRVTLLDSTKKKLLFIESAASELGLRPAFLHARAEQASRGAPHREAYDYVTARALARLPILCEYGLPYLRVGGVFAAMKSRPDAELAESARAIALLGGRLAAVHRFELGLYGPRSLIFIEKASPCPAEFPRCSAKIAKKAL
jgi:16S rRNA (guanine527-N7)-methyltransferase